ncbi:hypothetical protein QBC43DRAFT_292606 [Cladorrhinum sp. PSN259]|nr:hypothetical protein QBC43DRAFT_292606 [Cladorrhinum sp. PSN259]
MSNQGKEIHNVEVEKISPARISKFNHLSFLNDLEDQTEERPAKMSKDNIGGKSPTKLYVALPPSRSPDRHHPTASAPENDKSSESSLAPATRIKIVNYNTAVPHTSSSVANPASTSVGARELNNFGTDPEEKITFLFTNIAQSNNPMVWTEMVWKALYAEYEGSAPMFTVSIPVERLSLLSPRHLDNLSESLEKRMMFGVIYDSSSPDRAQLFVKLTSQGRPDSVQNLHCLMATWKMISEWSDHVKGADLADGAEHLSLDVYIKKQQDGALLSQVHELIRSQSRAGN